MSSLETFSAKKKKKKHIRRWHPSFLKISMEVSRLQQTRIHDQESNYCMFICFHKAEIRKTFMSFLPAYLIFTSTRCKRLSRHQTSRGSIWRDDRYQILLCRHRKHQCLRHSPTLAYTKVSCHLGRIWVESKDSAHGVFLKQPCPLEHIPLVRKAMST